jgi:hypothetical protein
MPKWAKTIIAILLLPLCIGAVNALVTVIGATGRAETFWVTFIGGAACWVVLFLLLPKPMLIYVFGHELTHVLWAWLFGGRVKRFRASAKGGHVVISKTNFLIILAPYFFPLYVVFIVLIFSAGHLLLGWERGLPWFHLLVGAAYAFHVTLTWHILRTRQSDITTQGYLFSTVIIFLGNICVLLVGLPLLTARVSLLDALKLWYEQSFAVLETIGRLF